MILAGMGVSLGRLVLDWNETHNSKGMQAFRAVPLRVALTAGIRCRHRFAMPA
jgi:hypothetical protein